MCEWIKLISFTCSQIEPPGYAINEINDIAINKGNGFEINSEKYFKFIKTYYSKVFKPDDETVDFKSIDQWRNFIADLGLTPTNEDSKNLNKFINDYICAINKDLRVIHQSLCEFKIEVSDWQNKISEFWKKIKEKLTAPLYRSESNWVLERLEHAMKNKTLRKEIWTYIEKRKGKPPCLPEYIEIKNGFLNTYEALEYLVRNVDHSIKPMKPSVRQRYLRFFKNCEYITFGTSFSMLKIYYDNPELFSPEKYEDAFNILPEYCTAAFRNRLTYLISIRDENLQKNIKENKIYLNDSNDLEILMEISENEKSSESKAATKKRKKLSEFEDCNHSEVNSQQINENNLQNYCKKVLRNSCDKISFADNIEILEMDKSLSNFDDSTLLEPPTKTMKTKTSDQNLSFHPNAESTNLNMSKKDIDESFSSKTVEKESYRDKNVEAYLLKLEISEVTKNFKDSTKEFQNLYEKCSKTFTNSVVNMADLLNSFKNDIIIFQKNLNESKFDFEKYQHIMKKEGNPKEKKETGTNTDDHRHNKHSVQNSEPSTEQANSKESEILKETKEIGTNTDDHHHDKRSVQISEPSTDQTKSKEIEIQKETKEIGTNTDDNHLSTCNVQNSETSTEQSNSKEIEIQKETNPKETKEIGTNTDDNHLNTCSVQNSETSNEQPNSKEIEIQKEKVSKELKEVGTNTDDNHLNTCSVQNSELSTEETLKKRKHEKERDHENTKEIGTNTDENHLKICSVQNSDTSTKQIPKIRKKKKQRGRNKTKEIGTNSGNNHLKTRSIQNSDTSTKQTPKKRRQEKKRGREETEEVVSGTDDNHPRTCNSQNLDTPTKQTPKKRRQEKEKDREEAEEVGSGTDDNHLRTCSDQNSDTLTKMIPKKRRQEKEKDHEETKEVGSGTDDNHLRTCSDQNSDTPTKQIAKKRKKEKEKDPKETKEVGADTDHNHPKTCSVQNSRPSIEQAKSKEIEIISIDDDDDCYTCEFCDESFVHQKMLINHLVIHLEKETDYQTNESIKKELDVLLSNST